jgi:hypothetical protein
MTHRRPIWPIARRICEALPVDAASIRAVKMKRRR